MIICYRPPGNNVRGFIDFLDQVLTDLPANESHNLCLVGDFNSKHSSWLPSQDTTFAGTELFNLTASFGLTQVVSDPTFTTNSGKDVLLDLIFVNEPHHLKKCPTLPTVTDHSPTLLTLSFSNAREAAAKGHGDIMWNNHSADYEGLRQEFSRLDLNLL